MKNGLLILLFSLLTQFTYSSHLVGGKFRLIYLGDSKYRIQLALEVDIRSTISQQNISVGIYKKSNNSLATEVILTKDSTRHFSISYNCKNDYDGYRSINIEYYNGIISSLPFDSTGYYINWERCCLYEEITNVLDVGGMAYSAYIEIPKLRVSEKDSTPFINNSPFTLHKIDPLLCLNINTSFNLAFQDIDGDSLAYRFTSPMIGGYTTSQYPSEVHSAKPYEYIIWKEGYGDSTFLLSKPAISLDANTGTIKLKPQQLGLYLVTLAIDEFRNGNKIGTVFYQFALKVDQCKSVIIQHPQNQYSINNSPVIFTVKHTYGFVKYQWYSISHLSGLVKLENEINDSLVTNNINPTMDNNRYLCYVDKGNCIDISNPAYLFVRKSTGVEKSNSNKILLYPNPTKNQVSIKGIENPQKISVYSLDGKLLKEIFNTLSVDVSDLDPGMYLVRATDEKNNSNYYGKLRVEN